MRDEMVCNDFNSFYKYRQIYLKIYKILPTKRLTFTITINIAKKADKISIRFQLDTNTTKRYTFEIQDDVVFCRSTVDNYCLRS